MRFSGRDYTADTAFRFSPVAVSREQPRQYSGVEVDTRVNVWTDSDTNPFSYGRAYQEILDTLEPGQTGTKVIRVADYYDEYPLWFSVDLPHLFITTDTEVACDKCGFVVYNDKLSCVQWCKYAKQCVGEETYEKLMIIARRNQEKADAERRARLEAKREQEGNT